MPAVATKTELFVEAVRAELVGCIESIVGIARKRSPKDVLKCIRLATVGGALEMTATNMELWAQVVARQVVVNAEGEVLTEAGKLLDAVRSVGGDSISLMVDGHRLVVSGAAGTCKLAIEVLAEFPNLPDTIASGNGFTAPAADIQSAVTFALHATPKGEIKHAIKGILFETINGKLTMMATDDRRVAVADVMSATVNAKGCNAIVPTEYVREIAATLPEGDITVTTDGNTIEFSAPDFHCRCPLMEGVAPPFRPLIEKTMPGGLSVSSDEWLSKLAVIALATDEKTSRVRLDLSASGMAMSSATENSDATSHLACKVDGPAIVIGLNVSFLIQAIQALGSDGVRLEWEQPNRPAIVRPEGSVDRLVLIVPINLNA